MLEDGDIVGFFHGQFGEEGSPQAEEAEGGRQEETVEYNIDAGLTGGLVADEQGSGGSPSAGGDPARSTRRQDEDAASGSQPPHRESTLGEDSGSVWFYPASCMTLTTLDVTKVVRSSHGFFLTASPEGVITADSVDPHGDSEKVIFTTVVGSEGPKTWIVVVHKMGALSSLGLDTNKSLDGSHVRISAVQPGLVQAWNDENPDEAVMEGDLIVSINGVSGDANEMLAAAREASTLEVAVERPGDPQVTLTTYHGTLVNAHQDGAVTSEEELPPPGHETMQFALVHREDGKTLFRTSLGRYLVAAPDGAVSADGEDPEDEWAHFEVSDYSRRKLVVFFKQVKEDLSDNYENNETSEGAPVILPDDVEVVSAWYGDLDDEDQRTDVTGKICERYALGIREFRASPDMFGESWTAAQRSRFVLQIAYRRVDQEAEDSPDPGGPGAPFSEGDASFISMDWNVDHDSAPIRV